MPILLKRTKWHRKNTVGSYILKVVIKEMSKYAERKYRLEYPHASRF